MSHTAISHRQKSIMAYIREKGAVQVEPLAQTFNVAPQTIRRDLNRLYDLELLKRVHGGAIIDSGNEKLGYHARKLVMAQQKSLIAARAAQLIKNNSSLIINIGTTTEAVAAALLEHTGLLVVTNNMNVANTLWPSTNVEVIIASGSIRREDGGIIGPTTAEFVDSFRVDYAVIGCSGIDQDGEIMDYDLREVRVAQSIVRRARTVVLVADSMKFQRQAPVSIAPLCEIDYLVTDNGVPAEMKALCNDAGVELIITDPEAATTGCEIN